MNLLRVIETPTFGKDDAGRPLLERNAPAEARSGVPMDLVACPYSGSRLGAPMNLSAQRQISLHFDVIKSLLAELRNLIGAPAGPVDPRRFLDVTSAVLCLPGFLLHHHGGHGPVPVPLAAAYKVAGGLQRIARRALSEQVQGRSPDMTPSGMLRLAEIRGDLVGYDEVCAGPPRLMQEVLAMLLEPPSDGDSGGELQKWLPEDRWLVFLDVTRLVAELSLLVVAADFLDLFFIDRLRRDLLVYVPSPLEALSLGSPNDELIDMNTVGAWLDRLLVHTAHLGDAEVDLRTALIQAASRPPPNVPPAWARVRLARSLPAQTRLAGGLQGYVILRQAVLAQHERLDDAVRRHLEAPPRQEAFGVDEVRQCPTLGGLAWFEGLLDASLHVTTDDAYLMRGTERIDLTERFGD